MTVERGHDDWPFNSSFWRWYRYQAFMNPPRRCGSATEEYWRCALRNHTKKNLPGTLVRESGTMQCGWNFPKKPESVCIRFLGFDHCACTIPSEQPSAAQGPETFRSRYAIPVPAWMAMRSNFYVLRLPMETKRNSQTAIMLLVTDCAFQSAQVYQSMLMMLLMSLFLPANALGVPDLLISGPHLWASNSEVFEGCDALPISEYQNAIWSNLSNTESTLNNLNMHINTKISGISIIASRSGCRLQKSLSGRGLLYWW